MSPELLSVLCQVNATGLRVPRTLPDPVPPDVVEQALSTSEAASAVTANNVVFMVPVWRAAAGEKAGETVEAVSEAADVVVRRQVRSLVGDNLNSSTDAVSRSVVASLRAAVRSVVRRVMLWRSTRPSVSRR